MVEWYEGEIYFVLNEYITILKKNMVEENISQEVWLGNLDEIGNYFNEEINQNEVMSKKQKKVCKTSTISNAYLF